MLSILSQFQYHNFTDFFLSPKKGPCGKMHTRQKNILVIVPFFWKIIFTYYQFSHLTTIFFIGKNSYFSCTIFFSHHSRIFSHHSRVFSHHSRVFSHHNRVLSKHNEVLSKHKRAKIRGKWSDSS